MTETALYYFEKARRCRRLAQSTSDQRANEGLTALAEEFEVKAKATLASEHITDLPEDGVPSRIGPNESGDPT